MDMKTLKGYLISPVILSVIWKNEKEKTYLAESRKKKGKNMKNIS